MTRQAHIEVLPDGETIVQKPGETILDASLRAGIPHVHACGGRARCSTCRIVVLDGLEHLNERRGQERALAERLRFAPAVRLACQTCATGGRVRVRRPVMDHVDELLANQLGASEAEGRTGEERRLGILFSDINGYTPFAAELLPYDITHVLNRYFHLMSEAVEAHGGMISDYIGDGLLALFGIDDERGAARRATHAALQMFEAVERLNPYLETMYQRRFGIRVGVHVGSVVVGSLGVPPSTKLAAIGDAVNVASRIETANKELGTALLVSESVRREVGDGVNWGRSFQVPLKGKAGEHGVHEVLVGADRPV